MRGPFYAVSAALFAVYPPHAHPCKWSSFDAQLTAHNNFPLVPTFSQGHEGMPAFAGCSGTTDFGNSAEIYYYFQELKKIHVYLSGTDRILAYFVNPARSWVYQLCRPLIMYTNQVRRNIVENSGPPFSVEVWCNFVLYSKICYRWLYRLFSPVFVGRNLLSTYQIGHHELSYLKAVSQKYCF